MSVNTNLFDLTGRVAVVTGSTKGIGRAVAEGLCMAGASVVINSRKQDRCDVVASEIAASSGGVAHGIACHVGDWERVPSFVDEVVLRFGRIDVLVNNAGVNAAFMTPTNMTLELWRKTFSVNLEGPLRMSQQVAPVMRDGGGGSIVNIGTMAAYHTPPNVCAYGASKAGLKNLTATMAIEWAPWNIRVNLLSPGPFKSEMLAAAVEQRHELVEEVSSLNLMHRIGSLSEIVGPVLYLASDASSYVTGDDITVSGGMRK